MKTTRPQAVNHKQIGQFLDSAKNKAVAARKNLVIDSEAAYQIAYESMLKASLALMLSHGSRPRVQLGHHRAIIEFAQQHLGPSHAPLFATLDHMRRKRNDAFYDVALISATEAKSAVEIAEKYFKLVAADISARLVP
jgi:uncharacterized protein (UPF0332 family)